jgi:alkylhydroperoxidase family enzyme
MRHRCRRSSPTRPASSPPTLIPEALHHGFATFGALMSPDLPLDRCQQEMIATVVSATNRTYYCTVSHAAPTAPIAKPVARSCTVRAARRAATLWAWAKTMAAT